MRVFITLDESACEEVVLPKTFRHENIAAAVMWYESDNQINKQHKQRVAKNCSVLVCKKHCPRILCAINQQNVAQGFIYRYFYLNFEQSVQQSNENEPDRLDWKRFYDTAETRYKFFNVLNVTRTTYHKKKIIIK